MYYNYKIKNIKVKVQINKNLAICNVSFPNCEEELQMRAYILNRFQGRQINDSETEHSLYLTLKNLLSYAK